MRSVTVTSSTRKTGKYDSYYSAYASALEQFLTKKKIGRKSRHLTTPSIRKQPLESTGTISPISCDESRNYLVPGVKPRVNEVNDNEKSLYLFSV